MVTEVRHGDAAVCQRSGLLQRLVLEVDRFAASADSLRIARSGLILFLQVSLCLTISEIAERTSAAR